MRPPSRRTKSESKTPSIVARRVDVSSSTAVEGQLTSQIPSHKRERDGQGEGHDMEIEAARISSSVKLTSCSTNLRKRPRRSAYSTKEPPVSSAVSVVSDSAADGHAALDQASPTGTAGVTISSQNPSPKRVTPVLRRCDSSSSLSSLESVAMENVPTKDELEPLGGEAEDESQAKPSPTLDLPRFEFHHVSGDLLSSNASPNFASAVCVPTSNNPISAISCSDNPESASTSSSSNVPDSAPASSSVSSNVQLEKVKDNTRTIVVEEVDRISTARVDETFCGGSNKREKVEKQTEEDRGMTKLTKMKSPNTPITLRNTQNVVKATFTPSKAQDVQHSKPSSKIKGNNIMNQKSSISPVPGSATKIAVMTPPHRTQLDPRQGSRSSRRLTRLDKATRVDQESQGTKENINYTTGNLNAKTTDTPRSIRLSARTSTKTMIDVSRKREDSSPEKLLDDLPEKLNVVPLRSKKGEGMGKISPLNDLSVAAQNEKEGDSNSAGNVDREEESDDGEDITIEELVKAQMQQEETEAEQEPQDWRNPDIWLGHGNDEDEEEEDEEEEDEEEDEEEEEHTSEEEEEDEEDDGEGDFSEEDSGSSHSECDFRTKAERESIAREISQVEETVPFLSKQYKLVDRLGEGTFSSVYKAVDINHRFHDNWSWISADGQNHDIPRWKSKSSSKNPAGLKKSPKVFVALKRIYVSSSPIRIYNELDILRKLRGASNIAYLIEAMRHEDQVIAVMPYNRHQDFRTYYRKSTLPLVRSYFLSLFRALSAAHKLHIIHRDVKPANFLYDVVNATGVLCDFGLAQSVGGDEWLEWRAECCHSLPGPSLGGLAGRQRAQKNLATLRHGDAPGLYAGLHGVRIPRPLSLYEQASAQQADWEALGKDILKKQSSGEVLSDTAFEVFDDMEPWTIPSLWKDDLQQNWKKKRPWYNSWTPATKAGTAAALNGRTDENIGHLKEDVDKRPHIRANRAGTRGFRAPEVLLKCPDQTVSLDIWSAGIILLCFLTRRFPFFNSADDTEALVEIAAVFGRKKIEKCAAVHNRTFITNVPNLDSPPHANLHELVRSLNPAVFVENSPNPKGPIPSSPESDSTWYHEESELYQAIDLLKVCLDLDGTKRWTAEECLDHPFFEAGPYDLGIERGLGPKPLI